MHWCHKQISQPGDEDKKLTTNFVWPSPQGLRPHHSIMLILLEKGGTFSNYQGERKKKLQKDHEEMQQAICWKKQRSPFEMGCVQ